jgi:hypothetical protein
LLWLLDKKRKKYALVLQPMNQQPLDVRSTKEKPTVFLDRWKSSGVYTSCTRKSEHIIGVT